MDHFLARFMCEAPGLVGLPLVTDGATPNRLDAPGAAPVPRKKNTRKQACDVCFSAGSGRIWATEVHRQVGLEYGG